MLVFVKIQVHDIGHMMPLGCMDCIIGHMVPLEYINGDIGHSVPLGGIDRGMVLHSIVI